MTGSRHEVGDVIGGYVLQRRLGSGASATVYLAKDGGGDPVALKLLNPDFSLGERDNLEEIPGRKRLRSEALALSKLDIPGIAHVSDLEVDGAEAFLVTEYIPGPTLEEDVKTSGPWVRQDVFELAQLLADTLTAVHAREICHRDIKPANVILGPNGPVLIDFGISFASGAQHLTQTGLVVGTPGFISPEVINGKPYGFDDDWWALAATLLFLLTGCPPFGAGSQMAQISRVLAGNPYVEGLDPDLVAVFREVLAPRENGRGDFSTLLETLNCESELAPTRIQDFTDWYSQSDGFEPNGETQVLNGRIDRLEKENEAGNILGVSEEPKNLWDEDGSGGLEPGQGSEVSNEFAFGSEEAPPAEPIASAPKVVPFTWLALSAAWAAWVPHSEITAGGVALVALWVAGVVYWHRRARRKILSLPAVLVRGLISGLPGMVGVAVPLVASYGMGNTAEVTFPEWVPENFEFFGTVVPQMWLARIIVAWVCVTVMWFLPAFAPIRTGTRAVIRGIFPRFWMRVILATLALGTLLAALILS